MIKLILVLLKIQNLIQKISNQRILKKFFKKILFKKQKTLGKKENCRRINYMKIQVTLIYKVAIGTKDTELQVINKSKYQ